jgi:hypothetical protein
VSLASKVLVMVTPLRSACDAFASNKRFAAQDAVLIWKRKTHELELLLRNCFVDGGSGARLRLAP